MYRFNPEETQGPASGLPATGVSPKLHRGRVLRQHGITGILGVPRLVLSRNAGEDFVRDDSCCLFWRFLTEFFRKP